MGVIREFFAPFVEPIRSAANLAADYAVTAMASDQGMESAEKDKVGSPAPLKRIKAERSPSGNHHCELRAFHRRSVQKALKMSRASFDGKTHNGQKARRLPRQ